MYEVNRETSLGPKLLVQSQGRVMLVQQGRVSTVFGMV